ncbi:MAG: DEAD/DEAH box helicase [candidate division KSB1 bacterium]|nr:DEAD/DEAH box helicase [candidate division KSB1 bacterium]MDZ7303120.1 DEAD/DEAH box helicase [candidate division KSB1 bacterium]MDZ7310101.1 DEAD/DEAH box helicase [candidate division KSB1 bacterium]
MTLPQLLDVLRSDPEFMSNVTYWNILPAKAAQWADFPQWLKPQLLEALRQHGISRLYTHQAEAIDKIGAGKNVVVVTPTASGKTLCYNLPVLNKVLEDAQARALYLFPTKALSQDQVAELYEIVKLLGPQIDFDLKTYTFDGDTPQSARQAIRSSGHIVVTNPDMLHQGILPHHTKWIKLFENLRYVVIDELHNYRGVFGSHLANVIRRLRRIAAFYGAHPQFICCSATIANPKELAEQITESEVELIDNNGAPRGEKHFILYNPPVVNRELGIRKSSVKEARNIASKFLLNDIQTIVFARSRLRVEILVTYLKETMAAHKKPAERIRGYRGGYLPTERRAIEHGLRTGEVLGVVSTNALELGIDIGQLTACVMAGYPGTMASAWQQAGRAGRRADSAVAVMVASSAPVDQYLINHPDYFFGKPPESGVVDPNNLVILMSHIKCAAFELPFSDSEKFGYGKTRVEATNEILEYLEENKVLHHAEGRWHWMTDAYPAEAVSLRTATPENVIIIDTTNEERVIGEVNLLDAPVMLHDDAIYLHEAVQYHVDKLDWDRRKAYVKQVEVDYYTDAHTDTSIHVLEVFEEAALRPGEREKGREGEGEQRVADGTQTTGMKKAHGEVNVNCQTTKFKKLKFGSHESIGYGPVELPEISMHTTAYWWEFPADMAERLQMAQSALGDALKALANALQGVAAIYLMCDVRDIRAVPMVRALLTQKPTIFIYDNHAGGVGFSRRLFAMHDELKIAARDLIMKCGCAAGCPSCVGPALEVGEHGKAGALRLIEAS